MKGNAGYAMAARRHYGLHSDLNKNNVHSFFVQSMQTAGGSVLRKSEPPVQAVHMGQLQILLPIAVYPHATL